MFVNLRFERELEALRKELADVTAKSESGRSTPNGMASDTSDPSSPQSDGDAQLPQEDKKNL